MLATIFIRLPFVLAPLLPLQDVSRDCDLEVLTPQVLEERALGEFDKRVAAYVTLHRYLARSLPPVHLLFDEEEALVSDELRAALVAARPHAQPGGFFTSAVGIVLQRRIDDALLYGAGQRAMSLYEPLPGEPGPIVNQPFPAVLGSVQWPALVRALPALPPELDYAVWGRDLVLVDVEANLVIDVLPDALPEGASPGGVYQ
jgi:hypothetical protein